MQFRKQAMRIQLIRYAGYSKEKKRAVTELIGSFPEYTISIAGVPADLVAKLTGDELAELQAWLDKRADGRHQDTLAYAERALVSQAVLLVEAVGAGIEVRDPDAVWSALSAVQKAMKKAGHSKPKSASKPGLAGQQDLL